MTLPLVAPHVKLSVDTRALFDVRQPSAAAPFVYDILEYASFDAQPGAFVGTKAFHPA